jgi:HK97 family phage major capsid protein
MNELKSTFEQFKTANDQRLKEIESKGSADVVTVDTVNAINTQIGVLQAKLNEVELKAGRPGIETADAKADEYRSTYDGWVRGTRTDSEMKAISVGTDSEGGFALPTEIDSVVTSALVEASPMRQLARVVSVGSNDFRHLINGEGLESGWVGEKDARPETATPDFREMSIPMGELYANPAATQRSLDDLSFNVEQFLAEGIAREFARKENIAFISGDGVNKPAGFLNTTPTATGSATAVQYIAGGHASLLNNPDKLIELFYSLKSGYRTGASWLLNSAVQMSIRTLKSADGAYLWQAGIAAGQPATLLGAPIVEMADMDGIAAGKFAAAYGNFKSAYLIADRVGIRTLRDPYTHKPYVHFYTTKRVGGALVNPEAIKVLKIAAS